MKPRAFLRLLLPVAVLVLAAIGAKLLADLRPEAEVAPPQVVAPLVAVREAEAGAVTLDVEAQGEVVPRTETLLVAEVAGRVRLGQAAAPAPVVEVPKGEHLLRAPRVAVLALEREPALPPLEVLEPRRAEVQSVLRAPAEEPADGSAVGLPRGRRPGAAVDRQVHQPEPQLC